MTHKAFNPLLQCNLKFNSESKGEFEGYASVFNSDDKVDDTILPGAFKKSLKSGEKILMFLNHDNYEVPIGGWPSIKEDDYGLAVKGSINLDHKDGPTLHSALERGDMGGMSIGFRMTHNDYTLKDEDEPYGGRIIHNVGLKEISIVNFPCEPKAMIDLSSVKAEEWESMQTIRDLEHLLRDEFGVSKSVAGAFLSHAKRILAGDLSNAGEQIEELQKKIAYKDGLQSLFNTLEGI